MQTIRTYPVSQMRMEKTDSGRKLVGLAIPYNSLSRDLGGFKERFMPGSVSASIARGEIAALFNHDVSKPLASQKAGTLRLTETSEGVHAEIQLTPGVSYADDAIRMLEKNEGTGMSFGFNPKDVRWLKEEGTNVAEVRDAELGEVSPLIGVQPAYRTTSLALRNLSAQTGDSFEQYGIDLDALAGVFLAIKRGLPLSESEQKTMEQARCLFHKIRKPFLEAAEQKAAAMLL